MGTATEFDETPEKVMDSRNGLEIMPPEIQSRFTGETKPFSISTGLSSGKTAQASLT
jgi:hypothetical protein